MRPIRFLASVAAALLVWACAADTNLPPATIENFVDSVELAAITGTPIITPSAFSIPDRQAVRTDRSSNFDFAFDIEADVLLLKPLKYLGVPAASGLNPGLQLTTTPFDSITTAEKNNYVTDSAVVVRPGDVMYARSRLVCTSLGVPQYGKFEVLSVDLTTRTIRLKYLVDNNCGYSSLEPGIPDE